MMPGESAPSRPLVAALAPAPRAQAQDRRAVVIARQTEAMPTAGEDHDHDEQTCRRCGAPATVLLFDGYWLCQSCSDELGREAMAPSDGS